MARAAQACFLLRVLAEHNLVRCGRCASSSHWLPVLQLLPLPGLHRLLGLHRCCQTCALRKLRAHSVSDSPGRSAGPPGGAAGRARPRPAARPALQVRLGFSLQQARQRARVVNAARCCCLAAAPQRHPSSAPATSASSPGHSLSPCHPSPPPQGVGCQRGRRGAGHPAHLGAGGGAPVCLGCAPLAPLAPALALCQRACHAAAGRWRGPAALWGRGGHVHVRPMLPAAAQARRRGPSPAPPTQPPPHRRPPPYPPARRRGGGPGGGAAARLRLLLQGRRQAVLPSQRPAAARRGRRSRGCGRGRGGG